MNDLISNFIGLFSPLTDHTSHQDKQVGTKEDVA